MRINRRGGLGLGLAWLAAGGAAAQPAAEWPARTVRLVVAYPPGGSTDMVARQMAERLSRIWGQAVVVENRPGASGALGADAVAKAPPDGYTLLLGASAEMAIIQSTMRNLPVDPARELVAVTQLTQQPFLVLTHPSVPATSLAELVALAKAQPGRLNYGSYGNGTSTHLLGELLRLETGAEITHIPYRGSGPLLIDLLSGQIQFTFDTVPSSLPHVREGRMRALALCHGQRLAAVPEIPTVVEAGFPYMVGATWAVLAAPARTPGPVLRRLEADARAVIRDGLGAMLGSRGLEPVGGSQAEATAFLDAERRKWAGIAQRAEVRSE